MYLNVIHLKSGRINVLNLCHEQILNACFVLLFQNVRLARKIAQMPVNFNKIIINNLKLQFILKAKLITQKRIGKYNNW